MDFTIFDHLPLWLLFVLTVAIVGLAVEIGYRFGQYRRRHSQDEKEAPVGAIVAATLGLLAFLLAFTFGLAASRFDARRMVVLDEANAIGTTFLRAGMLPAPHNEVSRKRLIEYVDSRLAAAESGDVAAGIVKADRLHKALWQQATAAAAEDPHSIVTGLFIQSLNEVIDLHSKRLLVALRNRVPAIIWLVLYFVTVFSMGALGYQEGLARSRRSPAVWALMLAFSAVIGLIADLDRPTEGLLRVSQRSLIDLRAIMQSMDPSPAATDQPGDGGAAAAKQ